MHIREATREDLPHIATVNSRAMMDDELSLWISPTQREHPQTHRERCLRTTRRRLLNGMYLLVAVTDEDDEDWNGVPVVVGYACYEKSVGAPDDSHNRAATWFGALERLLFRIEENYIYYFRNNLNGLRERWLKTVNLVTVYAETTLAGYKKYWELDFLAVDPAFGRRGIGGKLVTWGQDRAREDGVPLLLWASVKGEPLYTRMGFKEIDRIKFTDEGTVVEAPVMVWQPEDAAESQ